MKDKVFIDDRNILNWIPENDPGDAEGTKIAIDLMKELLDENAPMPIIVDLSKAKRPDKNQRQIIISGLQNNFHAISKVALFGDTPLLKTIAYFIIKTSGFENMRFFDSRNKAMSWLVELEKYAPQSTQK